MKKTKIIMLLLALICGISNLQAQEAKNAVGFNLAYAVGSNSVSNFGIGVKYDYRFTENLRVEPSFTYYFCNDKIRQQDTSINFHYLFNLDDEDKIHIYPIFGFSLLTGYRHAQGTEGQADYVEKDNILNPGCNLGVGFQYDITDDFGIVAEGKYKINDGYNQANIAVGCVVLF